MPAPSPRPWEAEFIRLWQAGATQAAIAEALGIPIGTVKSGSPPLLQRRRIEPRPRRGLVPV
jgi:DNA-directed RNA polymerase specialized sigma24 family protein